MLRLNLSLILKKLKQTKSFMHYARAVYSFCLNIIQSISCRPTQSSTTSGHFIRCVIISYLLFINPAASQLNIQQINSSKGIQAWLIPEPSSKVVSITFSFKGGAAYTPSDKRGMASLLATMLMEGTEQRSNDELKDYLLDNGIQLSFEVSQDRFIGYLRTTIDNLNNTVAIIREIMYRPRFHNDDLQRQITAQKVALEHQLKQPGAQAAFAHRQMIMANHPYTFFTAGTLDGLANITAADLKLFLQKIMTRDSLVIGICGQIESKQAGELLDTLFADLPDQSSLAQLPTPIGNFQAQTQSLTSSNPQAIVLFSQNGLGCSDPDFIKLVILQTIIGDGMTSRLWNVIREQSGLAYSIGTSLVNLDKMKLISGQLGTDPIKVQQAIVSIKKIWQDVRDNGVTDVELANAKSYLLGIFPLMFSSSTQTASTLHYFQVEGFDRQYFNNRSKIINDVSLSQVNDFAKDFINLEHLMITIIEKPLDRYSNQIQQLPNSETISGSAECQQPLQPDSVQSDTGQEPQEQQL